MKDTLLKEVSKLVIPFIQIFGIFVVLFGHLSPGGGFAGGTIIGTSFILYRIVFGFEEAKKKFIYGVMVKCLCFSIFLYGAFKGYSFISGGSHLELPMPPLGVPGTILSSGFILPLNIIVGIIVAITMYFLYSLFDKGEI